MRLVIGGPTRDTVPDVFAHDLAYLLTFTREHGPWTRVELGFHRSTYVHVGREDALQDAITRGATHMLWLDTDMEFPMDTALQLWRRQAGFVAANCVMRDPRLLFTAVRGTERVPTRPDSTGLEGVDSVGLAIALMRIDLVEDMARPLFRHQVNETGGDIGEDVVFCRRLRAAGHQVFIDHDLSRDPKVGHRGYTTYRADLRDTPVSC